MEKRSFVSFFCFCVKKKNYYLFSEKREESRATNTQEERSWSGREKREERGKAKDVGETLHSAMSKNLFVNRKPNNGTLESRTEGSVVDLVRCARAQRERESNDKHTTKTKSISMCVW